MMMMKLPILPCAEKLELVLSTAPKTSDNTDKDSKNRKRSHYSSKDDVTSSSAMAERPRELDQRLQMGGINLRLLWIEELLFAPLRHDAIYA